MSEQNADYDALRAIAEAADHGGRPWEWHGGYPQQVVRQGDAMLVAETYEGPDFPSTIPEFIATFDPPTVLRLIAAAMPPPGEMGQKPMLDAVPTRRGRTPDCLPFCLEGWHDAECPVVATSVLPPGE